MSSRKIEERIAVERADAKADAAVDQRDRFDAQLHVLRSQSRRDMFGVGLGIVLFGTVAIQLAFQSGRIYERNQHPDPIKAPENPDKGEGIPYSPPRPPSVQRSAIADQEITPVEIPVGVEVEDDGLVPIHWEGNASESPSL